jgi:hypothetical protein
VPSLIPSSFATRAIGRDVSITIFTPSSLNSGEKLFFGRGNFVSLAELIKTMLAFIERHNKTARQFNWKFTAADLTKLLARISARKEPASEPVSLPEAAR